MSWSQIFASIIAAVTTFVPLWIAVRRELRAARKEIEQVHQATNSMHDKLMALAEAKGKFEERERADAEKKQASSSVEPAPPQDPHH